MRVGLTGADGFIGWHTQARLRIASGFEIAPIGRALFDDVQKLAEYLKTCDAVVHLAGGRYADEGSDYAENIRLTDTLLAGLRASRSKAPLFFASTKAIEKDGGYGRSKKESMERFRAWGRETGAPVLSLIMPNVFGEFAQPDHHIALATFCRDIGAGRQSTINQSGFFELVYVQDVAKRIESFLLSPSEGEEILAGKLLPVPEAYDLLKGFYDSYMQGVFPRLSSIFERRLFAMLYAAVFEGLIPRPLSPRKDARGYLVETVRSLSPGQSFLSVSVPGAVRGNHYHMRKIERFSVLKGEGIIRLRKLFDTAILEYPVSETTSSYIDMPTFYTHSIENTGNKELITSFWTDELYDELDPDTYSEAVLTQ